MAGIQYNTERRQERGYVIPSLAMISQTAKDMREYKTLERVEIAVESELQRTDKKNDRAVAQLNNFGKNFLGMYPCVNGRELSREGDKAFMVNVDGGRELNVGEIQVRSNDGKPMMVADIDGVQIAKNISSQCYDEFLRGDKSEKMNLFASTFEDVKIGQSNVSGSQNKLISMGYDNAFDYPSVALAKKQFVEGQIQGYDNYRFKDYLLSKGINIDTEKGLLTIGTGHDKDGEIIKGKKDIVIKIDKDTAKAIVGGNISGDVVDIENRLNILKSTVEKNTEDKDARNIMDKLSFYGVASHASLSVKGSPRDIDGYDGQKEFLLAGKGREINPHLLESISQAGALRDRMTGKAVNIQSLKLEKAGIDASGKALYMLKGVVDGKEVSIPLTKSQAVDLMKFDDVKRIELLQNYSSDYFLDEPIYERIKGEYSLADYLDRLVQEKARMDVQHLENGKTKVSVSFNGNVASAELSSKQSEKLMAVSDEHRGRMLSQMFSKAGVDLHTMSYEEIGRMYIDKYVGKESTALANTTAPDKYESKISSSTGVKASMAAAMAAASFSEKVGESQSQSQQQSVGRGM